jgi:site-specific DNA-cytosine methylase
MNGKPSIISLFAGCGGSSLGYKWAGFKELLAIEWDKNAVDTFKLNFPEVPKYAGHQKRIKYNEPAPTICKPSSDKLKISPYLRNSHCHPEYTRTLSVRELARIGSFPDDFKFLREGGADRIGNSVPPLLMKAIAMQVQKTLHA